MRLLNNIHLPNAISIQYANLESKRVWGEKINTGKNFYNQIEYQTVKHGVRKCMIAHGVNPDSIHSYARDLLRDGLIIVPLSKEGVSSGGGFGHMSSGYNGTGSFSYRAVIARNIHDANEFVYAHNNRDDHKIGELLGFPKCCSEFFDINWKRGYFDPIWQQATNTDSKYVKNVKHFPDPSNGIDKYLIRLSGSEDAKKILSVFRYFGIRILSHFPCSFNCQESIQVANKWIDLGRELGIEGLDKVLEIMRLPFEWDCLKGVLIINTPVFKVTTTSVPCFPRYVIQSESSFYPEEAPSGIQFPWRFKGLTCN